ncbi:MAG: MATE family efflux transporter [Bacteroidota bacterium]
MKAIWSKIPQSALVLFDQLIVSGSNFLLAIAVTQALGLEAFGRYSLWWMVVLFALSLSQALITKPLLSLAPRQTEADYPRGVFQLQVVFGTALGCLLLVLLRLAIQLGYWEGDWATTLIVSLLAVLHPLYDFCRKYHFLRSDFWLPLLLDATYAILLFGSLGLQYFWGQLSVAVFLQTLLVIHLLVLLVGIGRTNLWRTWEAQRWRACWRQHFDYAKWLVGTALLQWWSGNYFLLAAAALLGPVALGAIRMVQNLMGLLHVLFLAMENLIPLRAAQQYEREGLPALKKYLAAITRKLGGLTALLLALIAIFAEPLLGFLYGTEQSSYHEVVLGFCLIYVFVFLTHPLRYALRTLGDTRPIFWAYVWGSGFSLLTAYPLVRTWSLYGVLLGLLCTQVAALLVYLFFLWKRKFFYESYSLGTR